jgi:hypothetical protein
MLGIGAVLGLTHHVCSPVTLVTSHGYLIPAPRLLGVFKESEDLRQVALGYVGGRLTELSTAAACHRVHSLRQRLARWLRWSRPTRCSNNRLTQNPEISTAER